MQGHECQEERILGAIVELSTVHPATKEWLLEAGLLMLQHYVKVFFKDRVCI